jgi:predicted porin
MGFSVAGSYGDLGDSLRTNTLNADDTHYWTVGGAYEYGPFAASVTYFDSEYDRGNVLTGRNEFQNLAVGVDYKMAPGFTPYAEVNFIEMDIAGGTADDNDGTVFIVGSQLNF